MQGMNLFDDLPRRYFLRTSALASLSLSVPRHGWAGGEDLSACAQVVETYVRDHQFQGVVSLSRHGTPSFWKTTGFADVETREPMAAASVFGIASISKMLTTVSVLRLQEKGILQLDQPVATYLPYFRKDLGNKLTLRYLMANNSGVPNLFSSATKADPAINEQHLTTEQAVHRFCEGDLIFPPGQRFDYSLSNWILVLAIVEAVTKLDYATAMRQLTLTPLELKATTTEPNATAVPSYDNATPPARRTQPRPPYAAAAGGYFSNATDLMRAAHLIFDTAFLSAASKRELTTIEVPSDQYALGGRIREVHVGSQIVPARMGHREYVGVPLGPRPSA